MIGFCLYTAEGDDIIDQQSNDPSNTEEQKHWYGSEETKKNLEVRSTSDFLIFCISLSTSHRLAVAFLLVLPPSLVVIWHTSITKNIKKT